MIDLNDRDRLEDSMTRFVLGELEAEEAQAFAELVARRPALRVAVERLQRAFGMMPYAVATVPPADLRVRVLAAASGSAARPSRAVVQLRRPRRTQALRRVVGAIAATLIVALAWDGYRLRQELALQRDVAATLQQPNVVQQFALAGSGMSRAAGAAVLDLDAKRAAVVIRGLPKLPPGQVYRLWARIGEGTVPCGQFNADDHGNVVSQFVIPVDAYTSPVRELFLNVEPNAPDPHPVGRTVMSSA
jgi:anti-sigma factor RsiW